MKLSILYICSELFLKIKKKKQNYTLIKVLGFFIDEFNNAINKKFH